MRSCEGVEGEREGTHWRAKEESSTRSAGEAFNSLSPLSIIHHSLSVSWVERTMEMKRGRGKGDERLDGEVDVEVGGEKGTDDGGYGMGRDVHHCLQLLCRHLLARHVLDQLLV